MASFITLLSLSAHAGSAIGHPVPLEIATGAGLAFTSAAVPVSTVVFDHCDNTTETVSVNATLDPIAGAEIVFPPGNICGLRINLSDRFLLAGTGPSNSAFDLSLGVVRIDIVLDAPVFVPSNGASGGTQLELASADWVTATMLGLDPNEHVTVGATHALHDPLRNAVRAESTGW
ncbi:MAG: hypothetical protein ABMB14_31845 [Myxococcota bacterium]